MKGRKLENGCKYSAGMFLKLTNHGFYSREDSFEIRKISI